MNLFFSGAVWSCTDLPIKLWIFIGQLQLDHPVTSWKGFLCVGFVPPHHTPTGNVSSDQMDFHTKRIQSFNWFCSDSKFDEVSVAFSPSQWIRAPWRTVMFLFWQASHRSRLPTQTACWESSAATWVGGKFQIPPVSLIKVQVYWLMRVMLFMWTCSHDNPRGRQRVGTMLLLRGDLRPSGVSVPVHRECQPGHHALLLHLTCSQQLAGVLSDLCRVVSSYISKPL